MGRRVQLDISSHLKINLYIILQLGTLSHLLINLCISEIH
jgi:hypothetical protein